MSFKNSLFISLLVITLIASMAGALCAAEKKSGGPVSSSDLKTTVITPVMDQAVTPDKNLVFCSTFQMAWNVLCNDIIKGALELSSMPPYAKTLNTQLDQKPLSSADSYLSMAGFGKDGIIDRINRALKEKFKSEAPELKDKLKDTDIIAYAFLYKNLEFFKEFESLENPMTFNGKYAVEAFGVKSFKPGDAGHEALKKQVDILYYDEEKGFIIKLASKSINDEIIISTLEAGKTLGETYESIQKAITATPIKLEKNDSLRIPKIEFDIIHLFKELIGQKVVNKGFTEYIISKALQAIKFKLNEKGAVLKSEAKIIMTKSAPKEGRNYIVSKPFTLYLKDKAAKFPYFMIRVNDAELLMQKGQ